MSSSVASGVETKTATAEIPDTPPSAVDGSVTKAATAEVPDMLESTTPKGESVLGNSTEPEPKDGEEAKSKKKGATRGSRGDDGDGDSEEEEDGAKKGREPKVMKAEVAHLVSLFDRKTGRNIIVEDDMDSRTKDKWAYNAIRVTNLLNWEGKLVRRVLEVNEPLLKNVLKDAIGDGYPGVSFKTARVVLNYPLRCMYHNLSAIEAECAKVEKTCSEEEKKFLDLMMGFLRTELAEDIINLASLMAERRVTYDLYAPNDPLFCEIFG